MRVNPFWTSPHVIMLETSDSIANGGFDLSLCFHGRIISDRGVPEQESLAAGSGRKVRWS